MVMDADKAKKKMGEIANRRKELAEDKTISHWEAREELAEMDELESMLKIIAGVKDDAKSPESPAPKKRRWL